MINPWALLAVLVAWVASVVGAFFYGEGIGRDMEVAIQAREDKVVAVATEAAASAAAHAISKLTVRHTTVTNKLETEIREKPIYRDCRSGAAAVELFNSTLPPDTLDPAGRGFLPPENAAPR